MFTMKMFVGRTQFEQFWIEQKQPIILIYIKVKMWLIWRQFSQFWQIHVVLTRFLARYGKRVGFLTFTPPPNDRPFSGGGGGGSLEKRRGTPRPARLPNPAPPLSKILPTSLRWAVIIPNNLKQSESERIIKKRYTPWQWHVNFVWRETSPGKQHHEKWFDYRIPRQSKKDPLLVSFLILINCWVIPQSKCDHFWIRDIVSTHYQHTIYRPWVHLGEELEIALLNEIKKVETDHTFPYLRSETSQENEKKLPLKLIITEKRIQ